MKHKFFSTFVLLFFCSTVHAQLNMLETRNLKLLYFDGHTYLVPHLVRCFENSLRFHHALFDYTPSDRVTLFLHDFDDYGSGGTSTLPYNFMTIGMEPFDYVYDTRPTNERMNWLMNHEIVHLVTTDQEAPADNAVRSLFFGKVSPTSENPLSMLYGYLTTPRWYAPRWYHEGIATFLETWMAGGIGRALGGYDEMVFRTMVLDSTYFYDFVGLESEGTTVDFQTGANSYLYGTRFVSYLANKYGADKLIPWFARTKGSSRYYASQFEDVFGVPLDDEWSHWVRWEQEWQRSNLSLIRKNPVTNHRYIYDGILGSVSRSFFDSSKRTLFVAINYPAQEPHIAAINIDDGSLQKICSIHSPALYYVSSLAYDPTAETLFYTTKNSRGWRDIYAVDIASRATRLILKDARVGDLVLHPVDQSLWGVQHHNGLSRLIRIPRPYAKWDNIFSFPYGKDIYDVDISPDGKNLSASVIDINGRQQLVVSSIDSLMTGNASFETLHEFENNSPSNFVFSKDGTCLYGTSYYTGVSNIFRYRFADKKMDIVSNVESGYFRPLTISSDSLIAFRYSGEGFQPVIMKIDPREDVEAINYLGQQIVERHPVVTQWKISSPALINIDSVTTNLTSYNSFSNLRLASAYPIVEGYKDFPAYGMRFNIGDNLGMQTIDFTVSYTPNKLVSEAERFHAALNWDYSNWSLSSTFNKGDFYDLFGPTKTSRKGYSLGLRYSNTIINNQPTYLRYMLRVVGYAGLEKLPEYQNITISFDKFLIAFGYLGFSHMTSTLGAVEQESGFKADLISQNIIVRDKRFYQFVSNIDYGFLLPLNHSSIWLRSSTGYCPEKNRIEPFANFYFGGFGNNWIDYQESRRYRNYDSYPGVELNEIYGTNFSKLMLEWVLPPIRFRRAGMPSLYCNYAQLSLFSQALITDLDLSEKNKYANVGAQLDFKLVLFNLMESTFSLGYAIAAEEHQRPTKEFMFSLKILR